MKKNLIENSITAKLKVLKKVHTGKTDQKSQEEKIQPKALFIFRRDLRIVDNTALIACAEKYCVCPIFIFTPEQVKDNPYKSSNAIQFMIESLLDLKFSIETIGGKFHAYFGDNIEVLSELIQSNQIKAVYFNKDYSPYSLQRDERIRQLVKKHKIECEAFDDQLLVSDIDSVKTNEGNYYYVFTHFYNRAEKTAKRKIDESEIKNWGFLVPNEYALLDFKKFCLANGYYTENEQLAVSGGRKNGFLLLEGNTKNLNNYKLLRNFPACKEGTSRLSAHNKFGTISIRELYWYFHSHFGADCDLIRQLYWRDFYFYLGYHFPEIYKGAPIPSKLHFQKIKWEYNEASFKKWCDGNTGFPIVDAGMRELNQTGLMHNRVRMIVAMFLTKDLLLNWQQGEQYFSNKLVDIDWAQNLGNWIWSAGTGPDGSPWLRIFNPWSQMKKIDPECIYVKRWVPELRSVPADCILNWNERWKDFSKTGYPVPMIEHDKQRLLALKAYGVKGKTVAKDD